MTVKVAADGWLEIPHQYAAGDQCFIALAQREPAESDWRPAFKRASGRRRVLALPPPAWRGTAVVWLRVNGADRREGTVRF